MSAQLADLDSARPEAENEYCNMATRRERRKLALSPTVFPTEPPKVSYQPQLRLVTQNPKSEPRIS